ncbi:hypothetical protein UFOVP298_44 [uncultured Caudovirales phage]|uniref:Uncharacterized protein n=1 Tax=uncultured Caudovirales phage TaxID=2100421 RepID=A0A6J5LTG0_9CAUD|nr:hypothetical protein UFOVP298_44 [uncultured Caudovirales phage]CAB4150864.1 hypothetical protein UFOVP572_47 [uncultured Caudovirales phage]
MLTPDQVACMGHCDGIYGEINGRPVVAHVVRADARGREIAATLRYVGGGAVPTCTIKRELDKVAIDDMERVQIECAELIRACDEIKAQIAAL